MTYCFDTSSFIFRWRSNQPDIFITLWANIEEMVENEEIVCPDEVLRELERGGDDLHAWAETRKDKMVLALEADLQQRVTEVTDRFPNFVTQGPTRNAADPWVIAAGMARGLTVVTEETRLRSDINPSIPLACEHFDVAYMTSDEFIRRQGWTF